MGELITLSCTSCGGELEVNPNTSILKCHYCGAEHLVRREGAEVSLESFARCPKCGRNDRVEKVTAILRSQPAGSGLAESLAPPERPSPRSKPQLLPKPEMPQQPVKPPRPKLNPKPETSPIPAIQFNRKNYWLIIGGVILFIVSYLSLVIFFGM